MNGRIVSIVAAVAAVMALCAGCDENKPTPVGPEAPISNTPAKPPVAAKQPHIEPIAPMDGDAKEKPKPKSDSAKTPNMDVPMTPTATVEHASDGKSFVGAGLKFMTPEGWVSQTPSSSMRLAQFELPGKDGAGEALVFCFGKGQGGAVEPNIARWVGMFKKPDDSPGEVESKRDSFESDGLKVTAVSATGTYAASSMGAMSPAKGPQADYALYGVIVEGGPEGTVFVKIVGPATTLKEHAERMEKMARGVTKAK